MIDAFIYDGIRSPFGRHAGDLSSMRADDLLAGTIRTLLKRGPFEGRHVEDVVVGCTNQAGEDCRNVAESTIRRISAFTSQPLSTNSTASQSSNSGCEGLSP